MHSKSLGVALLHAGHCLLGSFLRFVFSHHFHAVSHVGHHRACMGGHIETNVIRPGGQGKGRRDKRADQNAATIDFLILVSLGVNLLHGKPAKEAHLWVTPKINCP